MTLRLDKDGPARAEPPQSVVQPAGDADQFRRHRGIQIRPAKPCRALKRTILVENDALVDQSGPGQEIREMRQGSTILSEVHHVRCFASNGEMARDAQMTAHHVDELRIALGGPDRGGLTENSEQETGEPQPPEVSPNANVRPVTMMMMTAMILATGPSTDCRIWLSGCSHGMLEPAAQAGAQSNVVSTAARVMKAAAVVMTRRMRNRRWITAGLLRVKGRSRRPVPAR